MFLSYGIVSAEKNPSTDPPQRRLGRNSGVGSGLLGKKEPSIKLAVFLDN